MNSGNFTMVKFATNPQKFSCICEKNGTLSMCNFVCKNAKHEYKTNLTKEKLRAKRKALQDSNRVFLPVHKVLIMVAMDKYKMKVVNRVMNIK